jgi:hypothetical protein
MGKSKRIPKGLKRIDNSDPDLNKEEFTFKSARHAEVDSTIRELLRIKSKIYDKIMELETNSIKIMNSLIDELNVKINDSNSILGEYMKSKFAEIDFNISLLNTENNRVVLTLEADAQIGFIGKLEKESKLYHLDHRYNIKNEQDRPINYIRVNLKYSDLNKIDLNIERQAIVNNIKYLNHLEQYQVKLESHIKELAKLVIEVRETSK